MLSSGFRQKLDDGLHGAAFGLSHWSFAKIYVVSFRIPHHVLSGPMSVERFHELHGLFKLVPKCYVEEFAVLKLLEHATH